MPVVHFTDAFEALTGHRPFPWQQRLFDDWLSKGRLPAAIDIPTGLGKTAVMAVWLLARASGADLPRRLVYIVDRRAVVDQATGFAEHLREALSKHVRLETVRRGLGLYEERLRNLPISTLRGRHADNREWMADPTAPAIIVGTVDMVGSRLLFEGYGVSRRMRPYTAGLLGSDTLAMLDEAHLAGPFERLLQAIEEGQRVCPTRAAGDGRTAFSGREAGVGLPPPLRVLPLSATLGRGTRREPFGLDRDDRKNKTVRSRLEANKRLTVENLEKGSILADVLSDRAWCLMQAESETSGRPQSVAVYCDRRTDAERVAENLRKRPKRDNRKEEERIEVILFVGGRRVYERQSAAHELQRYGLIGDDGTYREKPVFLVATSAGEVGVDLDANHMVCDLVAWERMVQRLGRVNRRGTGKARILVIDQGRPDEKKGGEDDARRHVASRTLFDALARDGTGECQASPAALKALADNPAHYKCIEDATTCMPLYPELTRPLVDAWAMTSLEEHAGRPRVGPWLRGWVDGDEPQTVLIWRRYLPLRFLANGDELKAAKMQDIQAYFAAAAPQTVELLETETRRVVDWLKKRASKLLDQLKQAASSSTDAAADVDDKEDEAERIALLAPLTQGGPIAFLLDSANRPDRKATVLSLVDISTRSTKELQASLAGKRLVVDARFGGIELGLLKINGVSDKPIATIEDNWGKRDDDPEGHPWNFRVEAQGERDQDLQVGDTNSGPDGWSDVIHVPYCNSAEGKPISWLVVRKRRGPGESEDARAVARKAQHLDEHQRWASQEAARIADELDLYEADKAMLVAAARHHDNGKSASRWQRAFGAKADKGPFAKTANSHNLTLLDGFRHEFKSALDAERGGLEGIESTDPHFDLALHLIAAHHGYARPAIGVGGYDDLPPSSAEASAHAIAVRFARLQRKYGPWGLAWWEALLRAADQRASRRLEKEED